MDKQPFFSIIIPTYNRREFLKIAVDSVLSQSFSDYELIVVDDGSTDNTKEIVHSSWLIAHSREKHNRQLNAGRYSLNTVRYIYQSNRGPAAARNRGIKEAKGKFICFLDSDDRFRKQKLEIAYSYINKYPQYRIFHTDEIWYRNGKMLPQKAYHKKPDGYVFRNSLRMCSISISTAVINREVFEKVGLFDENMPACEDYDFWLRAASLYPIKLIPNPLTIKEGGHPDQQSKKFIAMDSFRIYAINKILVSGRLNGEQKKYAVNELKKKCRIYIEGAKKRNKDKEVQYYSNLIEAHQDNDR